MRARNDMSRVDTPDPGARAEVGSLRTCTHQWSGWFCTKCQARGNQPGEGLLVGASEDAPQGQPAPPSPVSPVEIHWLAKRLVARHLRDQPDWLLWEDVPYLSESAFLRLCEAVENDAEALFSVVQHYERSARIDTADLLSRAQSGPATIDLEADSETRPLRPSELRDQEVPK